MTFSTGPGTRPGRLLGVIAAMGLLGAACTSEPPRTAAERAAADAEAGSGNDSDAGADGPFHPDGWSGTAEVPFDQYDPVNAGETLPSGYRQALPRDAIAPVYQPSFRAAADTDWPDDELVIGVDLDGEARAYPVGFLNRREIVVDMHRGIPTFVTW